MAKDYRPDPYVVGRPRLGRLILLALFIAVTLGLIWAYNRDAGEGERIGGAPAPELTEGTAGTTGSASNEPAGTGPNSGPAAISPPAFIQELTTITGAVDGHELVGQRVNLHATVGAIANDVAFWVGEGDNRVLVVTGRDNRDGAARQRGEPSTHETMPVQAGQRAAISGTVQRLPRAEEMHSWGLTRGEAAQLRERPIYIRADSVKPSEN